MKLYDSQRDTVDEKTTNTDIPFYKDVAIVSLNISIIDGAGLEHNDSGSFHRAPENVIAANKRSVSKSGLNDADIFDDYSIAASSEQNARANVKLRRQRKVSFTRSRRQA